MVLQNKYKARASRRYQAQRGAAPSHSSSRGRGRPYAQSQAQIDDTAEADDGSDAEEEETDSEHTESNDESEDGPSTESKEGQAKAPGTPSTKLKPEQGGGKYSRRKLGDNSWRFEHSSGEEEDPDAPPEPEVDLAPVFERARIAHQEASKHGESQASDDDIDHSLAYLNDRLAARLRGGKAASSHTAKSRKEALAATPEGYEEAQQANREWREKNDAKHKIWGKLQDDLDAKKRTHTSQAKAGEKPTPAAKQVLQGQDFLDSILG